MSFRVFVGPSYHGNMAWHEITMMGVICIITRKHDNTVGVSTKIKSVWGMVF